MVGYLGGSRKQKSVEEVEGQCMDVSVLLTSSEKLSEIVRGLRDISRFSHSQSSKKSLTLRTIPSLSVTPAPPLQ